MGYLYRPQLTAGSLPAAENGTKKPRCKVPARKRAALKAKRGR